MSDIKFSIGPCKILVAPEIEDTFASWTDLGKTRGDTIVNLSEGKISTGRTDQAGSSPVANAVWHHGHAHRVTFGMLDEDIEKLLAIMPHATKGTDNAVENMGFGSELKPLAPFALALIPTFDYDANDVTKLWKSAYAHWFRKGYIRPTGNFVYHLPEGDDALSEKAVEMEFIQVDDDNATMGGIGSVYILPQPVSIMGVNNASTFATAVPDANLRADLTGAGLTTVQQMAQNTGALDFSIGAIADITGLDLLAKTASINVANNAITTIPSFKDFILLTNINLSGNNISQIDMSAFINEMWLIREELGANTAVINIATNNGVDATATNQINGTAGTKYAGDGLVDYGVTVTT